MYEFFNVGDIIENFCNGYFGRDDYDTKLCIMVTKQYAVFQYIDGEDIGQAVVLNDPERLDKEMVEHWKV